jgi:hypothetical protein
MNILGVELNNKEAVLCIIGFEHGLFNVKECRTRGISTAAPETSEGMLHFQFQFKKLLEDYSIERIAIKQRLSKGKFSGSANSFKMEAAIQLIDGVQVELVSNTDIKETLKRNPLEYSMKDLDLKQFQENAFQAAYTYALGLNKGE